jgi:hypothetical protein
MPRAFISYRRQDADADAGHIRDALARRLGGVEVFLDVVAIHPGQDFEDVLQHALSVTDVFLAVIGPGWLRTEAATGGRRLDNPEDLVRLEISAALKTGAQLIPILVRGASMPRTGDLPDEIRGFATRQAVVLGAGTWKHDIESLAVHIEEAITEAALLRPGASGKLQRLRRRLIPNANLWSLLKWGTLACIVSAIIASAYWGVQLYRTRDVREVARLSADLRYELPRDTAVAAIAKLRQTVGHSDDPAANDAAVRSLKRLVVRQSDTTDNGREIRRRAIEAIKSLRQNDLTKDFTGDDLTKVDLVDADLSRTSLKGLSFEGGFLIRTDFSAADLTGTNLSATWIRNADFGAATLTGANVGEMDWFNAIGFAPEQLRSVDRTTLAPCPKDDAGHFTEAGFRKQLDHDYAFKWEQFGSDRNQLRRAWSLYSQPGGLCEQVDTWLAGR